MYKPECFVSQGFGGNPATYVPLKGHTGLDENCGYGSEIQFPFSTGYVYKVLTPENPAKDGSGFTGIFIIVDDGIECFEWLVGHCNPTVEVGQHLVKGQVLGTEANHGLVFQNGVQITLAMQKAGDIRGAHRHNQKRPVEKSLRTDGKCLTSYASDSSQGGAYRDDDGYYYNFAYPLNGFNGCIDSTKSVFQRSLFFGLSGYDVLCLQRALAKVGIFNVQPTGFFGTLSVSAVMAYQRMKGISALGIVGPATTAALQKQFNI